MLFVKLQEYGNKSKKPLCKKVEKIARACSKTKKKTTVSRAERVKAVSKKTKT